MSFHKVEVDEEIFEYVKSHAEPLVDTFNSSLKRLLSLHKQTEVKTKVIKHFEPTIKVLSFPNRTPQALRHTLEVIQLVRNGAYDRPGATQFVAKQHNVFPQTVQDKYCRQLNLSAGEFDCLLEQPNLNDLKKKLKLKFPEYSQIIETVGT